MSLLADGAERYVERLGERHRDELLALADADPHVNVCAIVRLLAAPALDAAAPGPLGLRGPDGALLAAALDAGNLLPIGGTPADWAVLGSSLARSPRGCSSIVGRVESVAALWSALAPSWGPARAVRRAQPLLVLDRRDAPTGCDPRVRAMRADDLDRYLPASAAMFAEELGVDPTRNASPADYRRRVAELIAAGRAFGIVEDGQVIFKADVGAVAPRSCQVQGVWVRPDLRGRGIATAAVAEVLRRALEFVPAVSLYVNDFNTPARRLYARLGMTEHAVLSTVLF